MVRIVFYEVEFTQNSKMSSSEEEVEFSDENSDESPLSSTPGYEIEHECDGFFASPSASEDKDAAAAFAEGHCSSKRVVRLRSRAVGYERLRYCVTFTLLQCSCFFVFDVFKYSAESTWMANIYIILSIGIFYSLLLGKGLETAVCSFFRTSANVIVVRNWKAVDSPWKHN